jgi:hypothetical protein
MSRQEHVRGRNAVGWTACHWIALVTSLHPEFNARVWKHGYLLARPGEPETFVRRTDRFQYALVIGLLVCLGTAPQMRSQAVAGGAAGNPSAPVQSGQVVPTESMSTPSMAVQAGRAAPQTGARVTAVGSMRGPQGKGAVSNKSPRLCFFPGVGWVATPMAPASDAAASKLEDVAIPASKLVSGRRQPSGTKPAASDGCSEISGDTNAIEGSIQNARTDRFAQRMTLPHSTTMGGERQGEAHSDASLNPAISTALTGMNSVPHAGIHPSAGSRSGWLVDAARTRGSHAYISSIKLRRMIRSAPDIETRMKLRELQTKLEEHSAARQAHRRDAKAGVNDSRADIHQGPKLNVVRQERPRDRKNNH